LNSGPSSIEGFDGFVLAELRVTKPSTKVYRSDYKENIQLDCEEEHYLLTFIHHIIQTCTSCKSDVALTGRNRDLGTLIPIAWSKNWSNKILFIIFSCKIKCGDAYIVFW
jgi:hypothetical protein